MQIKLHKNATTTITVRQAIQQSCLSAYALTKQYGISENTARRWKERAGVEDASSRPHKLNTTLTKEQEALICFAERIHCRRKKN